MEEDGLSSSKSSSVSIGEWLDDLCIYYMGCGISCDEFWHGDYTYFHFYEQAEKARQKRENYYAWLDGVYTLKALYASVGNMFKKKGSEPLEYPEKPLCMTAEEVQEEEERKQRKREERFKAQMLAWTLSQKQKQEAISNGNSDD